MSTSLTLKGIPDDVYLSLKQAAQAHHRSLNNEAITVLESALLPRKTTAPERVARARALREPLKAGVFKAGDIDAFKRQGRR